MHLNKVNADCFLACNMPVSSVKTCRSGRVKRRAVRHDGWSVTSRNSDRAPQLVGLMDFEECSRKGYVIPKTAFDLSAHSYQSLAPSYKSKVEQFRRIFRATPVDTDRLLVDYACALSKNNHGLLLQGRMYVTENWICFYSKILYEQKIYLAVKEIIAITKEKTARVIPNAIQILYSKNHQRFFFTSFASRERTFAILRKVWENCRNHQTMSIDEIMQQVREIYGDDSLAMLEDADTEPDPDLSGNAYVISQGLQSTSDSSITNPGSIQEDVGEFVHPTDRPRSRTTQSDPSPKHSGLGTTDEDEFNEDGLHPDSVNSRHTDPEADGTDERNRLIERVMRCRTPDLRRNTNDRIVDTEPTLPVTHSTGHLSLKPERKKRSKKRRNQSFGLTDSSLAAGPVDSQLIIPDVDVDDPHGSVACAPTHDHPGQLYVNTLIPLSVDALFACIFTDSEFFHRLSTSRGTFNMVQATWPPLMWPTTDSESGHPEPIENIERTIGYTLSLKQKLGPRTCAAVEHQTLLVSESRPGRCYVVDAKVTNHAVPLCNCFCVVSRYCLLRAGRSSSRLCVSSRVVYEKPVFFGAKSIIENTCRSALIDFFTALTAQLTEMASRLSEEDRISGGYLSCRSSNVTAASDQSDRHVPMDRERKSRDKRESNRDLSTRLNGDLASVSRQVTVGKDAAIIGRSSSSPSHRVSGKSYSSHTPTSVDYIGLHNSKAAQEIGYFFLRPDRAWLLLVLISLLLCICLSMVYNRLVALEQLAQQLSMNSPSAGVFGPGSTPFDQSYFSHSSPTAPSPIDAAQIKLRSMRELTQTMESTLTQMQQVLNKVQQSIDLLENIYSSSGSRGPTHSTHSTDSSATSKGAEFLFDPSRA
ncbi:uncharacterized protein DEA37_0014890 [Paragonimus westermani]|uniref:VASt domain-containing protein n=1 Tax=Paragonimus westermani TaxID=34504 RepID=A0A5J4NHI4_9TREM|nr:uncharacterized protein DEA37_0014890 [Paragonimus westermani]